MPRLKIKTEVKEEPESGTELDNDVQFVDWLFKVEAVDVSDFEFDEDSTGNADETLTPKTEWPDVTKKENIATPGTDLEAFDTTSTEKPSPAVEAKSFFCASCRAEFPAKKTLAKHIERGCHDDPFPSRSVAGGQETSDFERKKLGGREKMASRSGSEKTKPKTCRQSSVLARENNFACAVCDKCFSRKGYLQSLIMVVHGGEKNFACEICKKSFGRIGHLKRHVMIHIGKKNFECHECKKGFILKSGLRSHMVVHTGEKNFQCHICQKSFNQNSNLAKHILAHVVTRKFVCDICNKTFGLKSSMESHMLFYTGQKNIICNICSKTIGQKSSLKMHMMLIHSGEKKFACHICSKSFSRKDNLAIHLLVHSGEKNCACTICGKCFNQKSYLSKHNNKRITGVIR